MTDTRCAVCGQFECQCPQQASSQPSTTPTPEDVVEWCAKELEWMGRGHVAHECDLLRRAAQRLRAERDKILRRAGGHKA